MKRKTISLDDTILEVCKVIDIAKRHSWSPALTRKAFRCIKGVGPRKLVWAVRQVLRCELDELPDFRQLSLGDW